MTAVTLQGTLTRWALHHPVLGFLTFGSYRTVTTHAGPDPRGLYTRRCDAAKRCAGAFYVAGHKGAYDGRELVPVAVTLRWTCTVPPAQ